MKDCKSVVYVENINDEKNYQLKELGLSLLSQGDKEGLLWNFIVINQNFHPLQYNQTFLL